MNIPTTGAEAHEPHAKTMGSGLHLVKVDSIEAAKDKTGKEIKDKRGYPALNIIFRNKEGEKISRLFFYSTLPPNDPARTDPERKCTTEFILANLKIALGLGTEGASYEAIKSKVVWLQVIMVELFTKDKVQLTKGGYPVRFLEVGSNFWPGGMTYEEVKAQLPGVDAQKEKTKTPDGTFYRRREDVDPSKIDCDQKSGVSKPGPSANAAKEPEDEPSEGDLTNEVRSEPPSW